MHQALHVSEVLLDIFVHVNQIVDLSFTHGRSLSRRSLAALATTCKTFHEPAMDLLWADLAEIEPLLGCVTRLHPNIYLHGAGSEGVEPLSEHEARQFLRHASRVRSLYISSDEHFHLLAVLPTETCMFPRLLLLAWQVQGADNRYLHLFLSHTLRNCYILRPHPALKSIGTRFAALEELSIAASDESTAEELSLLAETIRSCKQLKRLDSSPLEWATWSHLCTLPTLLTMHISGDGYWPLDRHHLEFAPFLNVTTLRFYAVTAAYAITAMQHSEFPSLKRFEMRVHVLPWAEAEQLFRALSQCKACQTLEHIVIFSFDSEEEEPPGNTLTAVTQFLCFTQLRSLWLVFENCSIYLDNDLLLKAMSSWPHLHRMVLLDDQSRPPTVTFRGLFAALKLCPSLDTLQLLIDAVNIDIDPKAESFRHTSLKCLDVGFSDVADADAVARIIFTMLPCVEISYPTDSEVWKEVDLQLESFRLSAALAVALGPRAG
ncbi:hypothetical protein DFH29DRAFT_465439 [Suillus ampliporus]|nr:hypothetical protein DFH29DRAFT_465439 [Suillus ampliporus]